MYDLYPEKLNEKTVLYCIGYRCFNGHQPLCQRKKHCVCDTEPACNPGDENCDPDAAKSTCNCEQPNGETVTIEQTVEEVEEINPDETAGDDETIINDEAAPETPAPAPAQAQPAAK